jgi:asparagine synthase (glutamine-hydrolysing)
MSGICAVWRKKEPQRVCETLDAAAAGLSVFGEGTWRREHEGAAGVGVCARFDSQQLFRNARVLLAYDADLLNADELAHLCGLPAGAGTGAIFAALYERLGGRFVEKLRGGFSLVLWDLLERRVVAAIDGFGMKRLVWYEDPNGLFIASRIDALRRAGIDETINPRAIANLLNFSAGLAPDTILARVQRLLPGSLLTASSGATVIETYWDMAYGLGTDSDEHRLSHELESVVERSVAVHCKNRPFSDLGAFLSGGTDSSTVVGMMTRAAGGPVKAFSIGFQEERFNELHYAEIAAKKFGAEHHTYHVSARDCFEALPRMIAAFDEPFGNSSAIPTYFCGRLAAEQGVKTLLAGDGGDELFGGNERYATDRIFQLYDYLPRLLRRGLIEPTLRLLPGSFGLANRARGYIRRANMPGVERMLSFQFLRTHAPEDIFEGDFLKSLEGYTVLDIPARHYRNARATDHLDRLLYVDMKITLADNDLPKVTCMSELAGVSTRFPFLDRSVAEFSGHIPAALKVKGFEKRYLFKKAFRELLPPEIIQKKKHGFGIPVATWMKTDKQMSELARDTLLSPRMFARGYFRRSFLEDLFRKHQADEFTYYGDALWTFLTLELWHRQTIDQPAKVA